MLFWVLSSQCGMRGRHSTDLNSQTQLCTYCTASPSHKHGTEDMSIDMRTAESCCLVT